MATAKYLEGMTECAICTEVYTDPRVLPCGHTFCYKCLETYSKNKQPGDQLACPMCNREFILPSNRVGDLPRNYAVANIVQLMESSPNYCDQHEDKSVDEFRKEMSTDAGNVAAGVDKCREMLQRLQKEKDDITEQVKKAEMEISREVEHLKEMSSKKQKKVDKFESLREEIETRLVSMESYERFVDKLRQRGTACDIARASSGLHDRADELLKFDVIERMLADLGHADVTFTSSDYVIDDANETLEQLRLNTVPRGELI